MSTKTSLMNLCQSEDKCYVFFLWVKLKSGIDDCLYLCKNRELELNENFEDLLRSGGVWPSKCLPGYFDV